MADGLNYLLYTYDTFLRQEPKVWNELNLALGAAYIRAVLQSALSPRYLWLAGQKIIRAMMAEPVYLPGWYHILTSILPVSAQRLATKIGLKLP
jgi:hypothetical protein